MNWRHTFMPQPVDEGSQWLLPSGAIVEVLPSHLNDEAICRYVSPPNADTVMFSIDFLRTHGVPL